MTTDAHHNEYLAAIAGLHEQTISPRRELHGYAIGDSLTFRMRGWSDTSCDTGRVIDTNESRQTLLVETSDDIHEVDPRPWPTGNVLPF